MVSAANQTMLRQQQPIEERQWRVSWLRALAYFPIEQSPSEICRFQVGNGVPALVFRSMERVFCILESGGRYCWVFVCRSLSLKTIHTIEIECAVLLNVSFFQNLSF